MDPLRTALFISHASPEDNHFVRWLGAKLTAMGYEVWADVMHLHGGADWARELESALRKRAVKLLVVCTPIGLDKQGVRNEIEIGTHLARDLGDSAFIIPLRLATFDAPFRIAHAQYIDFKGKWASGLSELTSLLVEKNVPRSSPGPMQPWLNAHAEGRARLLIKSEPLMSNWLEIFNQPLEVFYCDPPVGMSLERFQHRPNHGWPIVPHGGGVISFSKPDEMGNMGPELPGKMALSHPTDQFLNEGWKAIGIDPYIARNIYTDLGAQAFGRFCHARSLQCYAGAGTRISWWADIKTAPLGKVRFDWNFRQGARQIIGHSGKRGVHWHYAINAHFRATPVRHIRLAARLVFSDNGLDPIDDPRRAHVLRRSFAKGWRNARWRDMLCAYLWWLADGKGELRIPVAVDTYLFARVPPMQFGCPVSVSDTPDAVADDDDPDVPDDQWEEENFAEEAEE